MRAYVIAETEVTDPERYEQYKAAVPAAIAAGGGRFLVRGGESVVLEGDWGPGSPREISNGYAGSSLRIRLTTLRRACYSG